jgi:hypothetical protein
MILGNKDKKNNIIYELILNSEIPIEIPQEIIEYLKKFIIKKTIDSSDIDNSNLIKGNNYVEEADHHSIPFDNIELMKSIITHNYFFLENKIKILNDLDTNEGTCDLRCIFYNVHKTGSHNKEMRI